MGEDPKVNILPMMTSRRTNVFYRVVRSKVNAPSIRHERVAMQAQRL